MPTLKPNGRKRPAISNLKAFRMTLINPTTVLKTRKGVPMRHPAPEGQVGDELTLAAAVQMAIDTPLEGDDKMAADAKLKLDRIARRFASEEEFEISAKDATLALERANKFWGVMVYGELVALLDPAQLEA